METRVKSNELEQLIALLGDEAVAVLKQLAQKRRAQQLIEAAKQAAQPLAALAKEHGVTIQVVVTPTETRVKVLTGDRAVTAGRPSARATGVPEGLAGVRAVCMDETGAPVLIYQDGHRELTTWSNVLRRLGWKKASSKQMIERLRALGLWQG